MDRPQRERFDLDLVDWEGEPFEWDDRNMAHLSAHAPYTHEDVPDVLVHSPALFPADVTKGDADWLLVGQPPGEPPLLVPLAPGQTVGRARPIGIYPAGNELSNAYLAFEGRSP